MCILYIMITVYNNISVKYLKSKNKQDAMYVCTYKQIIFYIISVFASPLPYFLLLLLLLLFFPAQEHNKRQPLKKRLMTELQI